MRTAELRFQARQFEAARQLLDALLAQDPDNPEALGLLARCYAAEGQLEEAERVASRLKENTASLEGERAEWWTALESTLMAAQGDWGEAETLLRERIASDPDDLDAHVRLAAVLRASGRAEEGREALEAFVEQQRDDPEAWLALARYHAATGDDDGLAKASTALTRALLIEPGNLPALREAARIQAARGRLSEAMALCDRFLALRPGDDAMLYQKALLLWRAGDDIDAALKLVESAMAENETPEYLQLRGIIHLGLGDYAKAVNDLERVAQALESLPAMTELALAEAYLGAGQRRQARETLRRAEQKAASGETVDRQRLDALRNAISGVGAGA